MEEDEYRSTYQAINPHRCVFEKAINSRRCRCDASERFHLADREGVACSDALLAQRCKLLLDTMRKNARFALQLTKVLGPLPHAKEIRVQVGGMNGLQSLLNAQPENAAIPNIRDLVAAGLVEYGDIEKFPYDELAKTIANFEGRRKRQKK